jgi:hypothetical protein
MNILGQFCQPYISKTRTTIAVTARNKDHIEHTFCICPFLVAFFSVTIDGRNLIFGHKLYIGTSYRGKRFLTQKNVTKNVHMFNVYKKQLGRQTGSRNLTGPKTLPTIWHPYMKLVTKYQIPVLF